MNIKNQLHWKLIKGYPNKKMIMETIKNFRYNNNKCDSIY